MKFKYHFSVKKSPKYLTSDLKDIRTRGVNNLLTLNSIIMGLALTEAVRKLLIEHTIDGSKYYDINSSIVLPLIMLVTTLVSFYHGANRYLDSAYVFNKARSKKLSALIDLFVFFIEDGLFYLMALSINDNSRFVYWFLYLMALDTLWVISVMLKDTENIFRQIIWWMLINCTTFILVLFFYWCYENANKYEIIYFIGILRTILDYTLNWSFYFPDPEIQPD